MAIAFTRVLVSVLPLSLVLACGSESDRIVFEMQAQSFANSEWSEPVSLGPTINSSFNDQQATLSKDGLHLYFASARPEAPGDVNPDLNLWVAHRACADDSCPWESPVSLGSTVNASVNDFAPALSRDEHWLFFASPRQPDGFGSSDIWASYRDDVHDDLAWQEPINLGAGINTTGFEGGPSYFENDEGGGAQLYFNHNPAPVNSGGDIYVSTQAADGSWGDAVPVTELNSAASEQRPSISHDGRTIYFFSNRPGSSSDDIWVATRADVASPWTAPTNLDAPINTAADERHPFIYSQGKTEMLFFARNVATPPAVDLDLFVSTRTRVGNAP
ncbi:MAG TPA: hypothetical protein VGJ80_00010 [Gemmatimonadales bacterium]|jgi:hypothetical protein